MKGLLDTHTFLWWVLDDSRLSAAVREIMRDGGNELFFSAAGAWEIAIKAQLGKLPLPKAPADFVGEQLALNSLTELPVTIAHGLEIYMLPPHHRDPFDRMLVAQSRLEGLPIITADPLIEQYGVPIIW